MSNFIERMEEELAALNAKIFDLSVFLESDAFSTLDEANKVLLVKQHGAMLTYSTILAARLELNK